MPKFLIIFLFFDGSFRGSGGDGKWRPVDGENCQKGRRFGDYADGGGGNGEDKMVCLVELVSDEPLTLTLDDGKVVQGKLETDEDKIKVKIEKSENLTVEKKAVKVVPTIEEQKKYEIEQRRIEVSKLTDFWSGTVDVGFSMTSGNADTRTFTAGLRGVRETRNNKFTVYANALQIKDTSNNNRRFTAQSVW